mgnify:CR=1 FL=1
MVSMNFVLSGCGSKGSEGGDKTEVEDTAITPSINEAGGGSDEEDGSSDTDELGSS